jgi:hypothetical protein
MTDVNVYQFTELMRTVEIGTGPLPSTIPKNENQSQYRSDLKKTLANYELQLPPIPTAFLKSVNFRHCFNVKISVTAIVARK